MKKNKKNIQWIAASIENKKDIVKILKYLDKIFNILPDGWVVPKFPDGNFDFHMTIRCCKELSFHSKKTLVNKKVVLDIDAIGANDKAIAFREVGNTYSDNDIKHITIAFNRKNGGLPVDSNNIKHWIKIKPFSVKAVIRQFDYQNNKVYDIDLNERGSAINTGNFPEKGKSAGSFSKFPY